MRKWKFNSDVFFRHQGGYSLKELWFNLVLLKFEHRCGLSKSMGSAGPVENNSEDEYPNHLDSDIHLHNTCERDLNEDGTLRDISEDSSKTDCVIENQICKSNDDCPSLNNKNRGYRIHSFDESYFCRSVCDESENSSQIEIFGIRTSTNDSDFALIESDTEEDSTYIESDTEEDFTYIESDTEEDFTDIESDTEEDSTYIESDTEEDSTYRESDAEEDSTYRESVPNPSGYYPHIESDTEEDSTDIESGPNPSGYYPHIESDTEEDSTDIESGPNPRENYTHIESDTEKDSTQTESGLGEDSTQTESLPNPRENYTHKYKHLWVLCEECYTLNYKRFLKERLYICEGCGSHLKMNSSERLKLLIDPDTWDPMNEKMASLDPIEFHSEDDPYIDRINSYQKETGLTEAIQTGIGQLNGIPVAMGVMEFGFMGGSMGSVVGEKITRLIEYATNQSLPLIIVCASGGARMQEGSLSLMQMAKISSVLYDFQTNQKLFYVSILTSPTTGGVTASFGMLGDIVVAEPDAYIAFAGKRVIEQLLNKEVPEGSQETEYLFEKGLFDLVVPRNTLKSVLNELFQVHGFFPLNQNPPE
uniref:Acetyl-coenzyme A carboxylase carboxyl transferase subunit beta, chloroplastic n=1 Tax=Symphoricarpos orbiculatus TaxID=105885 RepID=A0A6H1XFJ1_SYMOR|nr:acetyl-CoA carboxylase beta subunit [Symphoricarpos orbiculatus]QJA14247.1 acetyl-CoA carboxylase beta subunit [Symphoricarpos orbiculatus]URQ21416.1 acetyl-CoA carboxylase carboxyltransferase beta [Symphoricarpos orbiculatus]